MTENCEILFERPISVSAMELYVCVRDELRLHEPEMGDNRSAYLADQITRRTIRDHP